MKEASSEEESEPEVKPKASRAKKLPARSSVKKEEADDTEPPTAIKSNGGDQAPKVEEEEPISKPKAKAANTPAKKATPAKRGKKTKEEKDAEAMPLAPRTPGLRMFVGAHVSAAKGKFSSLVL